ncbi:hypothetical protein ACHAXT_000344 [Thalassiosira profunda]
MSLDAFEELWTKAMAKHERFRFHLCATEPFCFEEAKKNVGEYTLELPHPRNPNEFKDRIDRFLTAPIDIKDQPWEMCISSGPIGASGAIPHSEELAKEGYRTETVALFRVHHVICDGVSLSAVVKDVSEEKERLDQMMIDALEEYKLRAKKVGLLQKLTGYILYYVVGSIYALSLQFWGMLTSRNPFDVFTAAPRDKIGKRSVAWKHLAPVDECKSVAKSISKQTKLNDLFVALLGSALERQYTELMDNSGVSTPTKLPPTVNIVVTAHLTGSILPWQSIGNRIGAFVTSVPFSPGKRDSTVSRLRTISKNLARMKRTPVALISWFITSLISKLGLESLAKDSIVRWNCHSVAVISNVHGFPFEVHWTSFPVKQICAFLPLPPKVPIGLLVTSYDGKIILSVESSDDRVVPDAERFVDFMLEEYERIKKELPAD